MSLIIYLIGTVLELLTGWAKPEYDHSKATPGGSDKAASLATPGAAVGSSGSAPAIKSRGVKC